MSAQADLMSLLGESQEFQMIPAANLRIDPRYQRELSYPHVRNIAKNLTMRAFGVLLVSRRDNGTMWVIDGQHRIEALKIKGMLSTLVPCHIYTGLSPEDEAVIFEMQTRRLAITPVQRFKTRLFFQEPKAMEIEKILHRYGFQAGPTAPGNLPAVASVEKIYDRNGPERLDAILDLVTTVTDHDTSRAPSATILFGLNSFMMRYEGMYDRGRLLRALQATGIDKLSRNANAIKELMREDLGKSCGRAILTAYNNKLSTKRLPDWDSFITTTLNRNQGRSRDEQE